MTDRDISGNAVRSRYAKARKAAAEAGLTPEVLETLAEGVREFDAQKTHEHRTTSALETIAKNTAPPREREGGWEWEERRLRKREVYAAELLAVATIGSDEEVDAVGKTQGFKRLVARLLGEGVTLTDAAP